MTYQNIPNELKQLNRWCCWKYEDIGAKKPTKVPYNPITGKHADVTDESTWVSFETVLKHVGDYDGIGFVFTTKDGYSFIDLDDCEGNQADLDRQIKIFREFNSYSEISPSGKGLHIIVKGTVPSGRRRSHIEIYSSARYATFTGKTYPENEPVKPIKDCQSMLTQLWEQMGAGGPATHLFKGDDQEKLKDAEVIEQAINAANSEKFTSLHRGEWNSLYKSQSEADYAYIDIIAFYTQNRNQISRIFRSSALGKRDKAKRKDYIERMINNSFDRMLPPLDFDGFKIALENKINQQKESSDIRAVSATQPNASIAQSVEHSTCNREVVGSSPTASTSSLPPGLLGEIAQFIYAAAPRPVPEIALAAAIGLMAGVCGRAYNVSGTGLNQYVLMLAPTGSGKEAMALGIDRLMNNVRMVAPTSNSFIGPSEIASGQALIKHLSKTSQCFVSILGEFGLRLEAMSSPHANSAEKALKRMLLDLYNKSGFGQVFRPSIFADADKNINATESPSFSILGESTPERFYAALNEDMISEGLLPRFMLIEYNGPRPPLSETHLQANPGWLIDKVGSLVAYCESLMRSVPRRIVNIESDPIADKRCKDFDKFCDQQINGTNKEVLRQLWNRAHIKTLKIAGLIAVGVNPHNPIIMPEFVEWAINMVQSDIRALSAKFEAGEIGKDNNELRQYNDMIRTIKEYCTSPWEQIRAYCGKAHQRLHYDKLIPNEFFTTRTGRLASYKSIKLNGGQYSSGNAIERIQKRLIDDGLLMQVNTRDKTFTDKYGLYQGKLFSATLRFFD